MDSVPPIGAVFAGKYRIEKKLGEGGMGAVYEVTHVGIDRRVALKVMRREVKDAQGASLRFTQEAQAAARIGHPAIVDVFDLGEAEDGTPFIVMELLSGRSLHEELNRGPMAVDRAVEIVTEMLRALEAAHRAGIIHRDIKPANVFLSERPNGGLAVKVLDFGIAKVFRADAPSLTESGAVVGSPLYMAPEQILAEKDLDGRVDVWAAGATLFEMLTGRPVHQATTPTAAAVKVVTERAEKVSSLRPEVDPALDAVVARALEVDRALRFASTTEMLAALEQRAMLDKTAVDTRPRAPGPSARPAEALQMPRKLPVVLLGVVALALGVAVAIPLVRATRSDPPREPSVLPSQLESVTAAAIAAPTASVEAKASSPATAPALPSAAPSVAPSGPVAQRSSHATKPAASCAASQVLSRGHCCALGLEWQVDHCDRPLAKAPF